MSRAFIVWKKIDNGQKKNNKQNTRHNIIHTRPTQWNKPIEPTLQMKVSGYFIASVLHMVNLLKIFLLLISFLLRQNADQL